MSASRSKPTGADTGVDACWCMLMSFDFNVRRARMRVRAYQCVCANACRYMLVGVRISIGADARS